MAFIQNVDNFLFCIYFGYLERFESNNKRKNKLLAKLFREIKSLLMGGNMDLGQKKINIEEKVKEILEEKDEEKRKFKLFKLNFDIDWSFWYPYILDDLINRNFNDKQMNFYELEVYLILYCIFVNGLDKTKGEKFNQIKKEIQPLIKILKEIFCEFDKNEIHKERTFIFALKSPAGFHNDNYLYVINNKDYMFRYFSDELKIMSLCFANNKDEKDERINKYYSIVLNYSLYDGEKEHKL